MSIFHDSTFYDSLSKHEMFRAINGRDFAPCKINEIVKETFHLFVPISLPALLPSLFYNICQYSEFARMLIKSNSSINIDSVECVVGEQSFTELDSVGRQLRGLSTLSELVNSTRDTWRRY